MTHKTWRKRLFSWVLMVFFIQSTQAWASRGETLTVFAPSSLTDVLPRLAAQWTEKSGVPVVFQFAATSQLARQVEQGAAADVLIDAHGSWTTELLRQGALLPPTVRRLFSNRLVVALAPPPGAAAGQAGQGRGSQPPPGSGPSGSPSSGPLPVPDTVALERLLKEASKVALAGEGVPAGVYGEEALKSLKLWTPIESKIVRGDHVRSVARWLQTGVVPVGVIYRTDALAAGLPVAYEFPPESHRSVVYQGAVVKKGGHPKYGAAFLDFLTSGKARDVYLEAGFEALKPGKSRPAS